MNTSGFSLDELFNLELRIARRADEIARRLEKAPTHPLEPWRQAEDEIWNVAGQLKGDTKPTAAETRQAC